MCKGRGNGKEGKRGIVFNGQLTATKNHREGAKSAKIARVKEHIEDRLLSETDLDMLLHACQAPPDPS